VGIRESIQGVSRHRSINTTEENITIKRGHVTTFVLHPALNWSDRYLLGCVGGADRTTRDFNLRQSAINVLREGAQSTIEIPLFDDIMIYECEAGDTSASKGFGDDASDTAKADDSDV